MITRECIEKINEAADIFEVVGGLMKLKKQGVNYTGCCPFHNEKTPSFVVNPVKQFYKCFGCGKSGGAVSFVMDHEHKTFPEAIEYLGEKYNIAIERDQAAAPDPVKEDLKERAYKLHQWVSDQYRQTLDELPADNEIKKYVNARLSKDAIAQWQIGFCGDYRALVPKIIDNGNWDVAECTGICAAGGSGNYECFHHRITFPIQDSTGRIIAFGGRVIETEKKTAKYINSKADEKNPIYQKSATLYGLSFATKAIRTLGFAYLVEGYMDVITMHDCDRLNTVGTCGTALTIDQCRILKKITDRIVIIRDGDAAGIKALERDIEILLPLGFSVETILLPDNKDPDDFFREAETKPELLNTIHSTDAVTWKLGKIFKGTDSSVNAKSNAIDAAVKLLNTIPNSTSRESYKTILQKGHDVTAKQLKSAEAKNKFTESDIELLDEDEELKRLTPKQRTEVLNFGFYESGDGKGKTGYWFKSDGGRCVRATNFILKPLYHIYGSDNRRMMLAINELAQEAVVEIQSKSLLSPDMFLAIIACEGGFFPQHTYNTFHHRKLINRIGHSFPMVYEINSLGYQPEGFMAFSNKLYKPAAEKEPGELCDYDEWGVAKVADKMYLSPGQSRSQEKFREGESVYENDMYLRYVPSPIDFSKWSQLMCDVYGTNAYMAIPWAVATLMRDVIVKTTPVPHLYAYGQKGSGKSVYGESITALFFSGKDSTGEMYKPMNLNQGTDFAFFNRYERFWNCPNTLNEFDENGIKDSWFRAIKGSYDGEGREKGKGEKNRTTTQKIRCSTLLMGQYLGNKDDNSVLTRSLPLDFKPEENRKEESVMFFKQLKAMETTGLSGILLQLLDLRWKFKKEFSDRFYANMKEMQERLQKEEIQSQDRMLKNVCVMVTCVEICLQTIELPYTLPSFKDYSFKYLKTLLALVSRTSGVSEFWRYFEFLISTREVVPRWDFDAKPGQISVQLRDPENKSKSITHTFTEPTDLLYIRFTNVYMKYNKQYRQNTGKTPIPEETMLLYMKDQPYWVGPQLSHKFINPEDNTEQTTTCFVLDMGKLPVEIASSLPVVTTAMRLTAYKGEIFMKPEETTLAGNYQFKMKCTRETPRDDGPPKIEQYPVTVLTKVASVLSLSLKDIVTCTGEMDVKKTQSGTFWNLNAMEVEQDGRNLDDNEKNEASVEDLPF